MANLNLPQIYFFIILIVAFGLLITEKIRNDIVALLIVLSLYLSGLLKSSEALSGFGSEPAIVVVSIFVLTAALRQTGLSELFGNWVGRLAGSSLSRALAVIMPSVALLSAFTHHVTTTAVMLPVTLNLSRERNIPASKLLMPLSFAASLGTTITIIGAPAFLLASDALQRAGRPSLGIFDIAPIGLAISALGTIFMLVVGRFLLPTHEGSEDPTHRFRLDEYFTEVTILPGSPFLGKTIEQVEGDGQHHLHVAGWLRNGRPFRRPFAERQLKEKDVLLVHTTPEEIVTIRQDPGVELHPVSQYASKTDGADGSSDDVTEQLVQAVVGPASDLVGRTIGEIDFRHRYGAIVVGIWRQRGSLEQELAKIRLRTGDVLVLQGNEEALNRVANNPSFLMMTPFQGESQTRRKMPLAGAIMLGTVLLAAFNLVTLEMATLAGAIAMVLTRCVTARQAYHAIDARIYVFIAGAIPLGAAMQKSGASELLAGGLQRIVGGWNEVAILMVLCLTVGIITQFMSDAATTALFAPVAIALAKALGQPPEAYVVTVAMASVAAFFTPIGHHGNLLVYGPGRYQFNDFVKVGTPLTILVGIVVALLAPLIWSH